MTSSSGYNTYSSDSDDDKFGTWWGPPPAPQTPPSESQPRTMVHEAGFHEFPTKSPWLPALTCSCRFRPNPDKSGHRIRSSGIPRKRPFLCRIVRPGKHLYTQWEQLSWVYALVSHWEWF
ncbi:unnamed protein product [Adineta ricciae]|uniref:Uncharacterized protein n=1 Tax=Adineta ricciae TaxID=249248 RepID=A0A814XJH4_ADIRI|nr:unnamed protein product [Adineta ricciae]